MTAEPASGAQIGPGAFVAIVGASGVGKDALMSYARERLAARAQPAPDVHFPRRVITRPAGAGEEFDSSDEAAFTDASSSGGFAIWWRAHGLGYGIPASADDRVRAGGVIVVNVSRAMLDDLAARYRRLVVVRVTVSDEVRAARLHARGREEAHDIRQRLARHDPAPDFPVDAEIRNDGTLAEAGEQLLRIISDAAALALDA
ncbi:phosphonate metabolism protein/1,5-bisphosphokinase (PRPP-forming) PhnN [Gryllotalpicola reticulitermitis]|uniref:Ribose 1,5-bisphosphate phosphokinase PhnN n=1 Tax=Gryllotalpicola reticulitermitis TaxID=1184153 RepID=A0ABV8Q8A3_9MICO